MNKKLFGTLLMGSLLMGGTFVSCQDYDDEIADLQSQINDLKGLKTEVESVKGSLGISMSECQSAINAAIKAIPECDAKKALEAATAAGATAEDALKAANAAAEAAKTAGLDEAAVKALVAAQLEAEKFATIAALDAKANEILAELAKKQDAGKYLTANDLEAIKADVKKLQDEAADVLPQRLSSLVFAPKTYINGIEAIEFANYKYKAWSKKAELNAPDAADHTIATEGATAEYYVSPENTVKSSIASLSFLSNVATNTRAVGAAKISTDLAKATIENGKLILKLKKEDAADWGTLSCAANGHSTETFPIVALKAVLADEVLTAEEKAAKTEVAVFSDWARVVETWTTPIIDNKDMTAHTGNGTWSYLDNRNASAAGKHFWNHDAVYPNGTHDGETMANPNTADHDKYIAKTVSYKETIDLNTLTQICTYTGTAGVDAKLNDDPKAASELGLTFVYEIVDYWYKNEGLTGDATNQAKFAKLDGSVLSSTAENGLPNNADAVGRTPLIRASLMDGANIVDVVYFKIQWAEVTIPNTYKTADPANLKTISFLCPGSLYSQFVGEEYMNNLYASMLDGAGMTRTQFHQAFPNILAKSTYATTDYNWKPAYEGYLSDGATAVAATQQGDLFLGKVDAAVEAAVKAGDMSAYTVVGFVSDLNDNSNLTQTHNIEIAASAEKINPTKEDNFKVDAFFAYKSTDGKSYVIIPVVIDVKKGTYTLVYDYLEPQWETAPLTTDNIKKTRPINPTLVSDSKLGEDAYIGGTNCFTTQLIGDFTYGYMKNSVNPTTIAEIYNYAGGTTETAVADIIFDETRFGEMAAQNGTKKEDWELDATKKILYYKGVTPKVVAAQIDGNKVYLIDNQAESLTPTDAAAIDAEPTVGALLLVWDKGVQEVFVPVVVKSTRCYAPVLDQYLLRFVQPLEVKVADGGIVLKDVLNYGSADAVTLSDQLTLKEAFGSKETIYLFTPYPTGVDATKNDRLIQWYEITGIATNLPKAKINLKSNGSLTSNVAEYTDLVANKNAAGEYLYEIIGLDKLGNEITIDDIITTPAKAADVVKIFYHNNSGQAITKDLEILVPVNMDTKWKKNVGKGQYIKVTVKPNI